jgi:hypothetical protein
MSDSDFLDDRTRALAQLATLQRLRDQAKAAGRFEMLESIQKLIEQERKALMRDLDDEPA